MRIQYITGHIWNDSERNHLLDQTITIVAEKLKMKQVMTYVRVMKFPVPVRLDGEWWTTESSAILEWFQLLLPTWLHLLLHAVVCTHWVHVYVRTQYKYSNSRSISNELRMNCLKCETKQLSSNTPMLPVSYTPTYSFHAFRRINSIVGIYYVHVSWHSTVSNGGVELRRTVISELRTRRRLRVNCWTMTTNNTMNNAFETYTRSGLFYEWVNNNDIDLKHCSCLLLF